MTSSRFFLFIALILLTPVSWSALTVNVTGVVVEGVCEINNGETIHVDFGSNLQSRLINGENFMKTIDYSLVCEDLTSNDLEMEFEGTATSFSDDYLATDREGLGIKLYMNGESMPMNTWMPFTWPEVPVLQAAPIKDDAAEVETGVFSASATLKIQYQ
ncbi:fimbrial protein [Enterobacter soli]|jgi:type 1 fimbria pilin|uniref:Fimbrial protein n=1 Tax=Enterobacter soli TaxID=885040 RepID=A0AAW8H8Z6_9ENTR|nr:fimbrial protein [Enterobacter soli]MDQ2257409.1 fimbrial protein [Enterobacter soli]MDQ2337464.1 fimbrial protein [Enterobacter soli]HED3854283.1 fimbrial protein [Enterobacter soli]HEE9788582.1 fimbrial protein [Enterobacter soli]HEE9790876.1 fimbrial protein [Enterobacter soli]